MTRFLASPMALALAAAITALMVAAGASAQTPPTCTSSICTLSLANAGSPVVDGCGDHATPGRMKLTPSSTDPNVTRGSFNINLGFITSQNEFSSTFSDWEWRTAAIGGNQWRDPDGTRNMNFSGGVLGENIIEVRPKAGARIWSRTGEMVIPVIKVQRATGNRNYAHTGETYLLFMGGKGCARVNHAGQTDGTTQ